MKYNYLFIIILLLVLANVYFLVTTSGAEPVSQSGRLEAELSVKQDADRYLSNVLQWTIKMNGKPVDRDLELLDSRQNPMKIMGMVTGHPVVFADFRFATCQMCVENELEALSGLATRSGPGCVFVIKSFGGPREQRAFEERSGIRTLTVPEGRQIIEAPSLYQSCIFVVDTSGYVRDYFVPVKDTETFHGEYYDLVYEKYFMR